MKIREIINEDLSSFDKEMLSMGGMEVVDIITAKGYNLALVKLPMKMNLEGDELPDDITSTQYQIGLSKEGTSFTDHNTHDQKIMTKGERPPLSIKSDLLDKVNEWVDSVGVIAIASSNPSRSNFYFRLLSSIGVTVIPATISAGGQSTVGYVIAP